MAVKKNYISWDAVETMVNEIAFGIYRSDWKPEIIVGITRGGLVPAIMLSHKLNIQMHTLDVRLRDADGIGPESNAWLAEFAGDGKNILIVDDINDTGATFEWIKNDWESCANTKWDSPWGNNVRFASLIDNLPSNVDVEYSSLEINKDENPEWIVFPWEGKKYA